MIKKCINCGKDLHKGTKYCSNKCQNDYIYKNYIQRWQNGTETGLKGEYQISNHLRRYLFEKCPNCHSLTDTTKRRGKGRKGRKKYYDTRNQ